MPKDRLTNNQVTYLEWLLVPETMRVPRTKKELAQMLEVSPNTLTAWEKLPLFQEMWVEGVKGISQSPERTQRLLDSLYNAGLTGDTKAAQLYLTATGQMPKNQDITIKHETSKDLTDQELESLIAQFAVQEKEVRSADKS